MRRTLTAFHSRQRSCLTLQLTLITVQHIANIVLVRVETSQTCKQDACTPYTLTDILTMQRRFHHGKTITADRNKRFDDSTVRCTGSRRPVGGVIRFRQPLPLPRASRPSGERRKGLMRKAGNLRCRPSSFITVTTVLQASRITSQPLVNHGRALRNIADQHRRPSSFISTDRGFAGTASRIAACGGPRSTLEEYR